MANNSFPPLPQRGEPPVVSAQANPSPPVAQLTDPRNVPPKSEARAAPTGVAVPLASVVVGSPQEERSSAQSQPPVVSSIADVETAPMGSEPMAIATVVQSASLPSRSVGGVAAEASTSIADIPIATTLGSAKSKRAWYLWPFWFVGRCLDFVSLTVLLAVVAGIPVLQFASLGYLLNSAANLARGERWSSSFPGLRLAGKLGTFALLASLSWLPVLLVTDLAYSAQLLQPNSGSAAAWRLGAFAITFAWVTHVAWAAIRGGRWWHFLWPAPLRFLLEIWRPATWRKASDALYEIAAAFHFPRLWWIGTRGAIGAFIWIVIPVSMMIVGLRAQEMQAAAVVGLLGALLLTVIVLYLPFLQIQVAKEDRFLAIFEIQSVRRRFLFAPWAHAISLLLLCALCIPLYLLRIEATPAELLWAPSLVFVLFMLPAKLLLGAAMGYAETRQHRKQLARRHWLLRWPARFLALASVLVYVGALYVAQLVAGQGAYVMYFQHAFLFPAPLISS